MIVPSAAEVLRCIEETLETVIRPGIQGAAEKSALASVAHLLRHVRLRIASEGQILADDVARLEPLLDELRRYLLQHRAAASRALAADIDAATAAVADLPRRYPDLEFVGQRAGQMRAALYEGLRQLQGMPEAAMQSEEYRRLRSAIRDYLKQELLREGELIHPAFEGRGPRR